MVILLRKRVTNYSNITNSLLLQVVVDNEFKLHSTGSPDDDVDFDISNCGYQSQQPMPLLPFDNMGLIFI